MLLPNIVVSCDLTARHSAVQTLLVQLDVLQDLDGLVVVPQERVESEETNQGEIAQHLVERVTTKVPSDSVRIALSVVDLQLLVDVGLVHQGVEHVQHGVDIPHLRVALQVVDLIVSLLRQLGPELGEGLELIDELVDDLPEPLVGQLQIDGGVGGEDVVEQLAVVVVRVKPRQ